MRPGESSTTDLSATTLSRLSVRLVPFLFLLYIVAYIDRINVSFAAPQMRQQLGFSDAVYGLGAGIFFAGYVLFQVPSTLVLQRLGAKRWIATLLVAWGIVSCSTALVRTPMSFYVLRFLLGAAEAGFFPGVILYLKAWFPNSMQARTVAWFMAAGPLAGLIGAPISGVFLNLHVARIAGWQWLFLLEGVPAVAIGIAVHFYLTNTPQEARWLTLEQREWLIDLLRREREERAVPGATASALSLRAVVGLVAVYFGLNVCSYGVSLWLPSAIAELAGLTNLWIGIVAAIPYAAAVAGMVLLGRHSDRTGERVWHIVIPGLLGAGCLIATSRSVSPLMLMVAMSAGYVLATSRVGVFWALANRLFEGNTAAIAVPMINALGNTGGFFGPYIVGLSRNAPGSGFGGGLLVIGLILAVTSTAVLLVPPPSRLSPQSP